MNRTFLQSPPHVVCLVKGAEKYIFLYTRDQRFEAMRAIGRMASNPELSLDWKDASKLTAGIKDNEAADLLGDGECGGV